MTAPTCTTLDIEIYHELRAACMAVFARHGIGADNADMAALLSRAVVRNAVIRSEYEQEARPGEMDSVRQAIAKRHDISERQVCRILYTK